MNNNKQHNQNRHKKQHKDKPQKPIYNPNKEQLQQNNKNMKFDVVVGNPFIVTGKQIGRAHV